MSENVWSCMKGAYVEGFECKDARKDPSIWGLACANECVISLREKLQEEQKARREAEEKLSQRADGTGAIPPANLPPVNIPAGADGTEPQEEEQERRMSNVEAIAILAELARKRSRTLAEVEALMMGANRLFHRHFKRQKNWARRRAKRLEGAESQSSKPEAQSSEEVQA